MRFENQHISFLMEKESGIKLGVPNASNDLP